MTVISVKLTDPQNNKTNNNYKYLIKLAKNGHHYLPPAR